MSRRGEAIISFVKHDASRTCHLALDMELSELGNLRPARPTRIACDRTTLFHHQTWQSAGDYLMKNWSPDFCHACLVNFDRWVNEFRFIDNSKKE